ncbi:MAG: helix-turn-helix domain-containing protein [Mycobacteriales bacterium]
MTRPARAARGSAALARRLRELREGGFGGRRVTQQQLATALGVKPASISAYENEINPSPPPPYRLRGYATFFATERSVADGRVIPDHDLTDDERAARDTLLAELLALAETAPQPPAPVLLRPPAPRPGIWSFPEGESVRLVCGQLEDMTHPYADPRNPNYSELLTFADLDALMELYAHVWKLNPSCDIRFLRGDGLTEPDDLTSHLVIIGGSGLNPALELILEQTDLPIRQRVDWKVDFANDGDVFDLGNGRTPILPTFSSNPGLGLIEDVGLLARLANPFNIMRTLTVCSGIYSRGVLGAVRTLTDATTRDQNEAYLAERFPDGTQFAILMRVPVVLGKAITPDLQNESVRLYEWPEPDEASGSRDDSSTGRAW